MPAKSLFGGLKTMDAFGKVRHAISYPTSPHVPPRPWRTSKSEHAQGRFVRIFLVLYINIGRQFGLAVTLVSLAIILSFTVMEFLDYRRVNIDTSVVVDRSRGEKLTVHLNVTYPRVPCYRACTISHSHTRHSNDQLAQYCLST